MNLRKNKYSLMIVRTASIAIAAVIWFLMYEQYQSTSERHTLVSQSLETESARFHTLNDKTGLVDLYNARFEKLKPLEQFQQENRLRLLDDLEKVRKKYRLSNFKYEIEPREQYKFNDGVLSVKGLKTFSSDIKLEFGVLHEIQLLEVLAELRQLKPEIFVVHGCDLKLASSSLSGSTKSANLSANYNINTTCRLKWFTFEL